MHVSEVVGNPKTTPFDFFLRAAEAVAHSLAITLTANTVETANDIERSIGSFGKEPDRGLLFVPDGTVVRHRDLIIAPARRAVSPAGGLSIRFLRSGRWPYFLWN